MASLAQAYGNQNPFLKSRKTGSSKDIVILCKEGMGGPSVGAVIISVRNCLLFTYKYLQFSFSSFFFFFLITGNWSKKFRIEIQNSRDTMTLLLFTSKHEVFV